VSRYWIATLATALLPAGSQAGVAFDVATEIDGHVVSTARVWIEGEASKTEFTLSSGETSVVEEGSYLLTNEDGTYMVTPSRRTFARYDMQMMEQMSAGQMASAGGNFGIEDVDVKKEIDEPGETIGGYATRHYRFRCTWKMSLGGMGSTEYETVADLWIADQLRAGKDDRRLGSGQLPSEVLQAIEALGLDSAGLPLRRVAVESSKIKIPGMGALGAVAGIGGRMAQRMATRGSGKRGKGQRDAGEDTAAERVDGFGGLNRTTTTKMQISAIRELTIPAAEFALPEGYRETQLFDKGPAMPGLNDITEDSGIPKLNDADDEADVPKLNDLDQ
jgi:hypothetical protein